MFNLNNLGRILILLRIRTEILQIVYGFWNIWERYGLRYVCLWYCRFPMPRAVWRENFAWGIAWIRIPPRWCCLLLGPLLPPFTPGCAIDLLIYLCFTKCMLVSVDLSRESHASRWEESSPKYLQICP